MSDPKYMLKAGSTLVIAGNLLAGPALHAEKPDGKPGEAKPALLLNLPARNEKHDDTPEPHPQQAINPAVLRLTDATTPAPYSHRLM